MNIKISRTPIGWQAVLRTKEGQQVAIGEGVNPHEAIGVCMCNARYYTGTTITFNHDQYTQVYISVNGMHDAI